MNVCPSVESGWSSLAVCQPVPGCCMNHLTEICKLLKHAFQARGVSEMTYRVALASNWLLRTIAAF